MLAPEARVLLYPKQTFFELSARPAHETNWLRWRRPGFLLLYQSSMIALLTEGRITPHLLLSPAVYWAWLPLTGVLGLAVAEWRWPAPSTIDRFFVGYSPWLLWLAGLAAAGSSPSAVLFSIDALDVSALAAALWSLWIDFRFFRSAKKLAIHRVVTWGIFIPVWVGSWVWSEFTSRLGV